MQLLGVEKYHSKSDEAAGDIISNKIYHLLDVWKCKDSIVSMCFDTTASNTGHLTGACVAIQSRLARALLWCACRHHVGEVLLTSIFEKLNVEASKSPEVTLFQRFKKHWESLELKAHLQY